MDKKIFSKAFLPLILAFGGGISAAIAACTTMTSTENSSISSSFNSSSTSTNSTKSVSRGSSSSETTISGENAVAIVNGDRVEIRDGKVSVNGSSYGAVGENAVVKYVVEGRAKKLFVDGSERKPVH